MGTPRFEGMIFDLMNTLGPLKRMMNYILKELPYLGAYIDDMAMFLMIMEEIIMDIKTVVGFFIRLQPKN